MLGPRFTLCALVRRSIRHRLSSGVVSYPLTRVSGDSQQDQVVDVEQLVELDVVIQTTGQ